MGRNWVWEKCPYTSYYKGKIGEKRARKRKAMRKEETGAAQGCTAVPLPPWAMVVPTGQPVVGFVPPGLFASSKLHFVLFCDLGRGFRLCWVILHLLRKLS
uniref:Uncharacterized protein n=1 Tax=Opuntia streptacantha TaxID=393608 RepID=A0A7C9DU75_OPUST